MRKVWGFAALLMAVTLIGGCGGTATKVPEPVEGTGEPADVRVLALKGPTAMGMVNMMSEADEGRITSNNYSFNIVSAVDEVAPAIAKGEADIAAVPANMASVLFNNTNGAVQALTINTLGVLYIVENTESGLHPITEPIYMKGMARTVYASGKGATPEYALNHIIEGSGLKPEDINIEWKSEHAECLQALLTDKDAVALLPEPFVTTALTKSDSLNVALDLTEEWDKLREEGDDSMLITGATIVRKTFAEEHPEAVQDFLTRYEASVKAAADDVEGTAALIGSYDIVPEEVAKKALPKCNIVFIAGDEMKEALSGYLEVLYGMNPQAVGGELPTDEFYYR